MKTPAGKNENKVRNKTRQRPKQKNNNANTTAHQLHSYEKRRIPGMNINTPKTEETTS
jgi:hypothetical protein